MGELPAFNENATCPKCGFGVIRTYFGEAGNWRGNPRQGQRRWYERDVLARICDRCHYSWDESPIAATAPARESASCLVCGYVCERAVWHEPSGVYACKSCRDAGQAARVSAQRMREGG